MANTNVDIKKISDLPLILRPKHVMQVLRVSKTTAYEYWNDHNFPGVRSEGRGLYVSRDAFCRFFKIPEDIIAEANRTEAHSLTADRAPWFSGTEFRSLSNPGEAS